MTTQSKGPMAGFGWLKRGISVSYRHPKTLLGGAAVLMAACVVPSLITLLMQFFVQKTGTPPSMAIFGWTMAVSMLLSLLIIPLYAGYLQVVDAAARGLPARALDVFKPYRQGEALPLIGYALVMIIIYIAMFGIVIAATGGGIASWYIQFLTAGASHQPPPALPPGFGITVVLFLALGIFIMGLYAISLGQIALSKRGVFAAIGDGLIGALKNLLPLIVFVVSLIVAWIIVVIVILIVAALIAFLAKLVGAWLMFVLIIPLYIAMMLMLFAVMFSVMYYLWRDVCGDDVVTAMTPPIVA